MNVWSNLTFVELMKCDPRKAFVYRKETLGEEIPQEWMTADELNGIVVVKEEEKKETEESIGFSIDDLKRILKDNKIKFNPNCKFETLVSKCKENGFI